MHWAKLYSRVEGKQLPEVEDGRQLFNVSLRNLAHLDQGMIYDELQNEQIKGGIGGSYRINQTRSVN